MSSELVLQEMGLKEALLKFNPKVSKAIAKQAVFDVYAKGDNLIAKNLKERVYDIDPTIVGYREITRGKNKGKSEAIYSYKRTGHARRGRTNTRTSKMDDYTRKIQYASTLDGAQKNYTPYLNKNSRIKRLNTLFWDDGVAKIKADSKEIMINAMKKILAGKGTELDVIEKTNLGETATPSE
jgi:hypothetical protein